MTTSSAAVLDRGMRCLIEELGSFEAERFVSTLLHENFDYTKWCRDMFDDATPEELFEAAAEYERTNPPDYAKL